MPGFELEVPSAIGTSEWVGAAEFSIQSGAPSLIGVGGPGAVQGWLMDAASSEQVVTNAFIPEGWSSAAVDLWWMNGGAGAGNVRMRVGIFSHAVGAATQVSVSDTSVTYTASAQSVLVVSQHVAAVTMAAGVVHRLGVLRVGADAADTLANDILLLGIRLRKVS